jgi:signal transduction histidine kinase
MLSIPGLKDLIKAKEAKRDVESEFADLMKPGGRPPGDFSSYLPFLAKRLDIELLALVEIDQAGKSAGIHAAGRSGLACTLTVPRLDTGGVLSGLLAAREPSVGKAKVFSGDEVFPAGESWCDLIPMDISVPYVFIPLCSLPLPGDTGDAQSNESRRCILAIQDAGAAPDPALVLKASLSASLARFLLALTAWHRYRNTLSILISILNEEGYSIGFVGADGNLHQKYGNGMDRVTADLLAKIRSRSGTDQVMELAPEDADNWEARAYPIGEPTADLQHLVAVRESKGPSHIQARRERLKLLSRFVSSVAHEIKNPLTGIAAGVQYLARKAQPGFEGEETVEFILSEINRLNRIVDDLYKIAKPPQLTFQTVKVKEILGKSLICLSEDITRKRLVVEQHVDSEVPDFDADADRLQQIFINIIKNAVEASPEGGTIRLELSQHGSRAVIRVTDSGPGISPEDREKIFEPFYSTKERGSGLGLCISQRIVDEHGGGIRIETPPGGGTSFVIEIPIRR